MHSGIGGLAHVLAEIRLARPWTDEEAGARRRRSPSGSAPRSRPRRTSRYFDGLVSTIGVLIALGAPGADAAVAPAAASSPRPTAGRSRPRRRRVRSAEPGVNDVTLGTGRRAARRALGAPARRRPAPPTLAEPRRRRAAGRGGADADRAQLAVRARGASSSSDGVEMPNWSHGLAGIAAALAAAGDRARPARPGRGRGRGGAEHLVTLGDTADGGFVVPRTDPAAQRRTSTPSPTPGATARPAPRCSSSRWTAPGSTEVAGEPPRRLAPALPAQRPGLGHARRGSTPASGTTTAAAAARRASATSFLDSWQRGGRRGATWPSRCTLADALVERRCATAPHAYWRFVEHRDADPLLPPGVGWMQGAAGIAAYLFRTGRVLRDGTSARALPRMDTWWALPPS